MPIELLHPSFEVIPFESYNEMINRVERAGRVCYQSESKGNPEAFIQKLIKSGHLSVIEHAQLSVKFIVDRGFSHELVRHRLSSLSQMSTRYVDHSVGCPFIIPSWVDLEPGMYSTKYFNGNTSFYVNGREVGFDNLDVYYFIEHLFTCARVYYRLRKEYKWSPQQARAILPNALKTEIIMTANVREWRHVLELRSHQNCHPDMYTLIRKLKQQLVVEYPAFFSDLSTPVL